MNAYPRLVALLLSCGLTTSCRAVGEGRIAASATEKTSPVVAATYRFECAGPEYYDVRVPSGPVQGLDGGFGWTPCSCPEEKCACEPWLRDRGPGVPTSLSDLRVAPGRLVGLLSVEHLENRGFQYSPADFDSTLPNADFLGRLRTTQESLFLAYGLSERWSVGLKVAVGEATFRKASADASTLATDIHESGLVDVRPEITWRALCETRGLPEVFTTLVAAVPHDRDKHLIGREDWLLLPGIGVSKGFPLATIQARFNFEYDAASVSKIDFGTWLLEAQRRISPTWWASAGLEGQIGGANDLDEVYLTGEVLWQATHNVAVRLRPRLGLTTRTEGGAVELGLVVDLR